MNEKKYLIQYTTKQGHTSQFYIKARSEKELNSVTNIMVRRNTYSEIFVTEINKQGEMLFPKRVL